MGNVMDFKKWLIILVIFILICFFAGCEESDTVTVDGVSDNIKLDSSVVELVKSDLNKKVRINCNMRFYKLKKEDYILMRKAGFRFLLFGLESANQRTLNRLNKGVKIKA